MGFLYISVVRHRLSIGVVALSSANSFSPLLQNAEKRNYDGDREQLVHYSAHTRKLYYSDLTTFLEATKCCSAVSIDKNDMHLPICVGWAAYVGTFQEPL